MEKVLRPCALMHPAFLPPSSHHGVLKSLLESPIKLPLLHEGKKQPEKQKCVEDDESSTPQSAFLGPTLWDSQLEYMDLDEFLFQIGIPSSRHEQPIRQQPSVMSQLPPTLMDLSHASTSSCLHQSPPRTAPPTAPNTPSPVDPDTIQVPVGFEPDPADLALSSVPGQETFDPRKRHFSSEELKPQPMIKKSRKIYMPEDLKDDRYWARRRKNNMAAKRSRDARRLKENQIAVRASFLEKENGALRQEVSALRQELGRSKSLLSRYQAQHGPL
uniref:BZIP domain-containing protein n=1 Tax=Neogobius melanostomus TaxID=47308 RepID=A0A8C6WVT3_9GOBI